MGIFERYYTEEFLKKLEKFRPLAKRIERKINFLVKNPYHNCKSELLMGNLKGLRSARFTKSIRIIFAICEECQHRNWQDLVGCSRTLCDELQEQAVVFFTIDVHEKAYRRTTQRILKKEKNTRRIKYGKKI